MRPGCPLCSASGGSRDPLLSLSNLLKGLTEHRKTVSLLARACCRVRLSVTPRTSVLGILQARILWCGLPCLSPEDLPNPGIELKSPALAGGFFTTEPPGKLILTRLLLYYKKYSSGRARWKKLREHRGVGLPYPLQARHPALQHHVFTSLEAL